MQYTTISESDLSRGIDVRSSENQLDPGFVRDLLNADIVERRVRKRRGYVGYAGDIPVRVTKLEYNASETEACFTLGSGIALDSSVSLTAVRSSPLVVYGRSNLPTGPFTPTDTAKYYSQFYVPVRKEFLAPSGTLSIPGAEHGFSSTDFLIGTVEATNAVTRSYSKILTNTTSIDKTSLDVSITYDTYQDREVFVYYQNAAPTAGASYVATLNHTGSGSETFPIAAGVHNLTNFNIVAQVQQDLGATTQLVVPDQLTISNTGTVSITIDTPTAATYYAILTAAPIAQTTTGVVGANATGTVTITPPAGRDFAFFGIYLEQTPGGTVEAVYPDTVDYDATAGDITLSFQNEAAVARNFIVYYSFGDVRSNKLCVTDASVSVDGTDESPQLTIWGLIQEELYPSKSAREGWVNHIDSYRRSGEQRMISGLGGNLFSAREYSEVATAYKLATLYPRLVGRVATSLRIGPAFYDTGDTPQRTRGYITSDNSGTNWAQVTAIEYDTGLNLSKLTISLPNKQILDSSGIPTTLAAVVATSGNLNDYITLTNMSYARHNGEFRIEQVQDGTDEIFVWADIPDNSSDYDDSGLGGEAAILTDQIELTANADFIPADTLVSAAFGIDNPEVVSVAADVLVCRGVQNVTQVPAGVQITGMRTSSVVPLRSANPNGTASVTNMVRGDMLSYTGIARLLRIKYINSSADITGSISDGVITISSGDTTSLSPGQKILLLNSEEATGVHTIDTIDSPTQITLIDTSISAAACTIAGSTIQLDEELQWQEAPGDGTQFQVARRWIPVEAPDDTFDLTPETHVRHFDANDYTDQPFLRSSMVSDTMFLTNNSDAVTKFDGTSLYRAGLPAWQPGLFLTQETNVGSPRIVSSNRFISYSTATVAGSGEIEIAHADVNIIPAGATVRISGSTQTYTVRGYEEKAPDHFIQLDRALDSSVAASGTIYEIATYRYYFRLNAVDANGNVVASAAAQSQDYVVEHTADAGNRIKLVGFPVLDNYDYDRLEVQIYRTKKNTAAPFYLITTLPLNFNNTTGYVEFYDSFADSDLIQLDPVHTALAGAELGINWSDPVRAKYVTAISNRLYLANLTAYPELTMQVVGAANLGNSDFAGDSLLFRKSDLDTGTTTDMVNRVRYEWKNGITGNVSAFTIGTDEFSFDTSINTGAVTGDWIYLTYASVATTGRPLTYSGWWQIASVSGATVTVNLTGAAATSAYPDRYVIATDPTNVPVLLGTDGNLGMVNGDSFDTFDSMRRMGLAISATMRQVDISLTGMEEFTPWLITRSGNDVAPAGKLIVKQPQVADTTISVVPTFSGYNLFVNEIQRTTGTQVSASTAVYPSRVIVSYENYPEIFDSPDVVLDADSNSAIDVNSADGQEITGIIPFFGQAAFTAAQQAAIVVVFKTNSIYLVDLNEKLQGRNPVQRIETEGLGCTAPYSIAATKMGIMFANESGIYCLRRDQSIQYLGKYMERNWTEQVSLQNLQLAQGHHYGVGRMYKLSVPLANTETDTGYLENTEVYAYNHTAEDEGKLGAWGRYDAHRATGWANLGSDAFFGATYGRVFQIRNTGLIEDFRDDSDGINMRLDTRALDFGNSGIRKVMDKIVVHYRSGATATGTVLGYAIDMDTEYEATTPFEVIIPQARTGIDDSVSKSIVTIRHSIGRRKGVYIALRIENGTIDENIEIAGLQFVVGGLATKGITQAAQTRV